MRWLSLTGLLIAAVALVCCGPTSAPAPVQKLTKAAAFHIDHDPPSAKDVIDAVIANGNIDLSASPSCKNVGTEPTDRTIGRYVAGFLSELSKPDGKNWIQTDVAPGAAPDGNGIWVCRMTIRHVDGDDRWGWGVQFNVRKYDGLVAPDSFTCIGGG